MTGRARRGYMAVALAACLWAFGGTYARDLIDRGASALEITEARAWIAVLGIGAIVLARGRVRGQASLEKPAPFTFVLFGLSIATANYFYYAAIAKLPVAVAIVTQYTAPALVVLWFAVVEGRRPSRRVAGALALALAGVALLAELPRVLATGDFGLSGAGMAAAAISAVAFASYMVLGERLAPAVDPEGALFRGFLVASIFWIVVQAARGRPDTLLDGSILPGVVVIGICATILPFLLFLWGLGRIGASRAGIVSALEPLAGALLALVWLDQSLNAMQIAGAAMVVAGIAVVQSEQEEAAPRPAPLE